MRKLLTLVAIIVVSTCPQWTSVAQWADPAQHVRPRSLVIQAANEYGGWTYSGVDFNISGNLSVNMELEKPTIYIIRSIFNDARAQELGIKAGAAYLFQEPGTFQFVRDIDVRLTDSELCALFGVEPKRGLHVTYVIPRQ